MTKVGRAEGERASGGMFKGVIVSPDTQLECS